MTVGSVLRAVAGDADRFVVVDTETTGVYPSDRIVEIALVTLSLDGQVLDVWDTLVQPERDVGATHIHGITASMVASAPTFADIAGDIAVRLHGACLVAHNVPFDARMLQGEFERLEVTLRLDGCLDTLRATGSRLAVACECYGIELTGAHRALNDALATTELVRRVADLCERGAAVVLPMALPRRQRVLRREDSGPTPVPDPPLIAFLASRLRHDDVEDGMLAYLDLLDRAVADLHLDPDEREALTGLAQTLGLSEQHTRQAHRRFLNELLSAMVDDHEVTDDEYETLVRVAAMLDVDQGVVERKTRPYRSLTATFQLRAGQTVVFTGDRDDVPRDVLVAHAADLGLEVGGGVTKRTDLLVAADPESSSGKAEKARRYGVPIAAAVDFAMARPDGVVPVAAFASLKAVTCPDCLAIWTVPATSAERAVKKCAECATVSPLAADPALSSGASEDELLVCEQCATQWTRQRTRGRKPRHCPACRS